MTLGGNKIDEYIDAFFLIKIGLNRTQNIQSLSNEQFWNSKFILIKTLIIKHLKYKSYNLFSLLLNLEKYQVSANPKSIQ
jgi:hypothetical protein